MQDIKEMTGYPSIDKPWMKYYDPEVYDKEIPAKTMYQLILDSNKDRMNYMAIDYYGTNISYRTLMENIDKASKAFWAKGIREGDIVTIISLNTPETQYCLYALNQIGAVANLLYASIPPKEILDNLRETDSKMLLILDKVMEKIGELETDIPVVILSLAESMKGLSKLYMTMSAKKYSPYETYRRFILGGERAEIKQAVSEEAPAVIVYTSGTTGTPKGVVLSSRNLNAIAVMCSLSGKNYMPGEKFLNILPPFVGFGVGMLHLNFYAGLTEIIALVPKAKNIIKMFKKHCPERYVMGPAFTDSIEKNSCDMSHMIDLTGGGGAISVEKERKLNDILAQRHAKTKYLAGYGMTELASGSAMNTNGHYKEQSVGIPLPLTNAKVIDTENGQELGYDQEGELLVHSPGLMLGYFHNEEETASVIEMINGERWIHTGDVAKIDRDGFIYITGRIKRIYITQTHDGMAYKIFPQRLEETIEKMEEVERCACVVVPDQSRLNVPIVIISINNRNENTQIVEIVKQKIKNELPEYYAPQKILLVDDLPMTASQKIDYRKLKEMALY